MSSTVPTRAKKRWITAVFFFVSGIITASWASRIPDVQRQLALNDAQWGLVLFTLPAGLVCGLPLSSWLVAKYSSRLMMVTSMLSFSLLLCLLALSTATWQLVPVLFIFGISRNLVSISVNANALEVQRLYEKPIIATFHGLWSLACFIGAGIGTLMIARHVIPLWHFVTIAICTLTVSLIYKGNNHYTGNTAMERKPFFIAPDRYLLILGLIALCSMICEGTMFDWSVNYFERIIHVSKEKVTAGYTSFISAMALGRFAGDKIIARFGAITVLVANGIIMAAGYALAVFMPYLLPASAGFMLVGLGDSIVIPLVYTLAAKSKKMPTSYAIASVTMIGYIGFLCGPVIVGTISDAFGMQWSFALMGLLTLTIALLALWVKKETEEKRSE
jgi:MFS family permease